VNLRSVTAKILIWSLSTLLLSLAAYSWITRSVASRAQDQAFARSDAFELYQAVSAYEHGGHDELARYLADLHRFEGYGRYVTDASGRDLLTGEDRSALLKGSQGLRRSFVAVGDKFVLRVASPDWRYRYVIYVTPFSFATFAPYYFLFMAVVAVLFWFLAMHFAWPLRQLAAAVRRFGSGDLTARVGMRRRDEIGEAGRAFDNMAARIQTLLTAERQLLQDVSHELRSPLTRLRLAAELAGKADDRTAALSRVRRETDRLSDLVSSLLQMTMAEGDPSAISVEEVCLSDILREVVRDCQLEAEHRGCQVEVDAPEDVRTLGDAELLQRAIENIIRNAIRYSPAGARVETSLVVNEAHTVLSVRDYGPGVPEDLLPKIFNPFFRVDESRDTATGGIGLGLAIAQRAIRLHHGDLRAANANPGLVVSIVLQRAERSESMHAARHVESN
jgi:two-component system sensor histidine kinase CpxA